MEWKPIETAPKNGREILVWDHSQVRVVHWDDNAWISDDPTLIEQHLAKWHPKVKFFRSPSDPLLVSNHAGMPSLVCKDTVPSEEIDKLVFLLNEQVYSPGWPGSTFDA